MIQFGAITDLHYCEGDNYLDRHFSKTLNKLIEANETLNSYPLDFVVNLGDTIDHDFLSFQNVLTKLSHIKAPLYTILGNHDYDVKPEEKILVPKSMGLNKLYYEVIIKEFQFLFLNGNEISTYANLPDSPCFKLANEKINSLEKKGALNGKVYNGGLSQKQINWLDAKIQFGMEKKLSTIIFCHFPIFPPDKHNLLNDHQIIELLGKSPNVKAWICGHNHEGNYGKINNCHVINLKGMVETESHNSFAIFELKESMLVKKGFGREADCEFAIN